MSGLEMKYFILKPRGDSEYARASRKAMLTYANEIEHINLELANELRSWVHKEHGLRYSHTGNPHKPGIGSSSFEITFREEDYPFKGQDDEQGNDAGD